MARKRSKRQIRVERDRLRIIDESFTNFSTGLQSSLFVTLKPSATTTALRESFGAAYGVLYWLSNLKNVGEASLFLREINSSLPTAISLSALGLYEAAHRELRYVLECFLAFLYFRDHPRELELALANADLWDLTRPSATTKFLRKLREFSHTVGIEFLNDADRLYGDLSKYTHPRSLGAMAQRQYLTDVATDPAKAKAFGAYLDRLSASICALLLLADFKDYRDAPEIAQAIMVASIPTIRRRKIERYFAAEHGC